MTPTLATVTRALSIGTLSWCVSSCAEPVHAPGGTVAEETDPLAAVEQDVELRFPKAEQLEPDALAAWISSPPSQGLRIVDVRAMEEFAVSHIPGAVHIPEAALLDSATLQADAAAGRHIVLYCSVGWRSSRAAEALAAAGIPASNLRGSMFRWAIQDRPIVNEDGATKEVHPYDATWGLLLPEAKRAALPK